MEKQHGRAAEKHACSNNWPPFKTWDFSTHRRIARNLSRMCLGHQNQQKKCIIITSINVYIALHILMHIFSPNSHYFHAFRNFPISFLQLSLISVLILYCLSLSFSFSFNFSVECGSLRFSCTIFVQRCFVTAAKVQKKVMQLLIFICTNLTEKKTKSICTDETDKCDYNCSHDCHCLRPEENKAVWMASGH